MKLNVLVLGIDHVQLAAPPGCEAQARTFFTDVLGMGELEKPETLRGRGGVWFECGVHQLHVGVERDFEPARKAHPAFLVQDLTVIRARLEAQGIEVSEDVPLPRQKRLHIHDPFGNRLEFVERLDQEQ